MEYFLPGEINPRRRQSDEFVRGWYSKHLRAMDEPSLLPGAAPIDEAYRFLWLRTFHHPIVVRVQRVADRATIHCVELDGAGGYEPGNVLSANASALDDAQWFNLTARLHECDFWGLPSSESATGIDGAQWVFEGLRNGERKFVHRWSPESGVVRDLGLRFLELASIVASRDVH